MASGIYLIECLANGKGYVGSSVDISSRISTHKANLRGNKHKNPHLQNAWNKYGEEAFEFKKLFICKQDFLIETEQWFKDSGLIDSSYNIRVVCNSNYGLRMTEEQKIKLSNTARGRKASIESRKRMSESKKELAKNPAFKNILLNNLPDSKGINNPNCKLTEAQVLDIIARINRKERICNFSHLYPCKTNLIYEIKAKRAWKQFSNLLK